MNKLKKQVIKMLKENTGKHFLDSGNAYGRNWERNQIREFEIEKSCNMEADNYNDKINVEVTFNIYHYLVNHLELNQETDYLNKKFNSFINLKENKNNCYLTIMELFSVKILNVNYKTINTCNYDNLLSQVIQYVVFKWENEDYIILQIHNGCDVRGGYTKPYIFKITDYDYFTLAQYNANLFCQGETIKENGNLLIKNPKPITYTKEKCINNWFTDDTYHWYYNGSTEDKKPLKDYTYIDDDKNLRCKECKGVIISSVITSF